MPLRDHFAGTDAALVLVLVVVAVAAHGYRLAGVLAALSAGASFDFFLTYAHYRHFTITHAADIETAVLFMIDPVGVTELAFVRGRRQQALASREAGYLAGIRAVAKVTATSGVGRRIAR